MSDTTVYNGTALLSRCLAFSPEPEETRALRRDLITGGWRGAIEAAKERGLTAALAAATERRQLAAGIPSLQSADGLMTPPLALADGLVRHAEIRAAMRARLIELTGMLNAAGMEPLLLKGARSLWTGAPTWRAMGDLDILTPGRAAEAQRLAMALGYAPIEGYANPDDWHHELNLYRADLPGWLEFHDRAAMHRADVLLPTEQLVALSERETRDGVVARILPEAADLLYCVVHHHVSHRGDKFGTMSLKGLYEFAMAFSALSASGQGDLAQLAGSHPRLMAALDLWIAAAVDRLGMPVAELFPLEADAVRRSRAINGREARENNYDGLLGELAMALSGPRLKRVSGGKTWLGRQRLRLKAVQSLVSPATVKSA